MSGDRILIVDHNREFLRELERVLLMSGYETVAVSSTEAVLTAARASSPSAILLDLDMPGNRSLSLAHDIARCRETADVPIVGMSFFSPDEEFTAFLESWGIHGCLVKPFTFLALIGKIELAQCERTPYLAGAR